MRRYKTGSGVSPNVSEVSWVPYGSKAESHIQITVLPLLKQYECYTVIHSGGYYLLCSFHQHWFSKSHRSCECVKGDNGLCVTERKGHPCRENLLTCQPVHLFILSTLIQALWYSSVRKLLLNGKDSETVKTHGLKFCWCSYACRGRMMSQAGYIFQWFWTPSSLPWLFDLANNHFHHLEAEGAMGWKEEVFH